MIFDIASIYVIMLNAVEQQNIFLLLVLHLTYAKYIHRLHLNQGLVNFDSEKIN